MKSIDSPQWTELGNTLHEMYALQKRFFLLSKEFNGSEDAVELLRLGLKTNSRHLTLKVCQIVDAAILQQIFNELISCCSYLHGDTGLAFDVVMRIPKEWLQEHIEEASEPILVNEDEMEYNCLSVLYTRIDTELTRRLALRALGISDLHEFGQDLLESLDNQG